MITLRRLDLVRQQSPATADELKSLEQQINALPFIAPAVHLYGARLVATPLPTEPSGVLEFSFRGVTYVLPFYRKA